MAGFVGAAALPVAGHLGLLLTWDLAARPVAMLGAYALCLAGLVVGGRRLAALPGPKAVPILVVAALLRCLLLVIPPTLSDDVLRYAWDGKVVGAGFDPYRLPPDAEELRPLRDEPWSSLPHRDVPSVYPPLAMGLFSIAARTPAPVAALAAAFAAADLLTCALLVGIARRAGIARERVIWYAWHPLATLEVAGMAHVDGLGVAAVAATVYLLMGRPRRLAAPAAAAAAAVLAKLVPLVALPAWARASGRPLAFLALAGALVAAVAAPFLIAGVPPGLVTYGVSWEFNGPLFEPLWRLLEGLDLTARVEAGLDRLKLWHGDHELWNRLYPFNYPQLLAKVVLAAGLGATLLWVWRERRPGVATGRAFGALVLFSATVYPWYLLWILPWAALWRHRGWLALAATLPLTYLPQTTSLPLLPWIFPLVWLPFVLGTALGPRWSTG